MRHKEKQSFIKPVGYWSIILGIATSLAISGFSVYSLSRLQFISLWQAPLATPTSSPTMNAVAALGRLEPQGEVIRLSANNSQGGVRVAQLQVKKGDKVRKGQLVAILDNQEYRLAALIHAQKQVEVARANLEKVKAGAKSGDIFAQQATIARLKAELQGEIAAQQATIARLKAELRNAEIENRRYQWLYKQGAISASNSDSKHLRQDTVREQLNEAKAAFKRTVQTLQKQLSEAKAKLESIKEVRPTDVQAAQTEVESNKAVVKQAQADLELSIVRSPISGQIMKIHTWPGEIINSQGIAELGRTNQMYVVAEVYETDIDKVRLGQAAIITSDAFSGKIRGTVADIGLLVSKQNIFNNDPGADTDNKVVDVKIRINDPTDNQRVSALTDLQVQVFIQI